MNSRVREKERELEELEVDHEIASKKADIAEKKAAEAEMKRKYGPNWRKLLGYARKLKPNREVIEDLYIASGKTEKLRDMSRPDKVRVGRDNGG